MRSVTWVQSKSHLFVNTAYSFRERSHTHKSMPHVRPTGIFKPELWILCLQTQRSARRRRRRVPGGRRGAAGHSRRGERAPSVVACATNTYSVT